MLSVLCLCLLAVLLHAQPPMQSPECKKAASDCESATDCVHRLAVLQSACVTNTCQPQCREAALNLYQNREGRALLRTDASCVPGRYELEKCGFLPNKSPKHCSFAKLICETDLQCNSKWEVFVSECEADTNELGHCPEKCHRHLNATLSTQHGAAFASCTCTDKEDGRCTQLRELTLLPCLLPEEVPLPRPGSPSGGGPDEEEDADLSANRVSPSKPNAHSQSDVPDGAPQGVARGHCLLLALPLALTLISSSFWAMR
uniref:GDNF/GAS1 domain-containing protein n=1 Tax=Globodera rostochiensis TaxID=31243 RepID=A0A914GWW9_GLORO